MNLKLAVNNTEIELEGNSVTELLKNIPLKFPEIKTKAIITLSNGVNTIQHFFPARTLRLIVKLPSAQKHWAKRLEECLAINKSVI